MLKIDKKLKVFKEEFCFTKEDVEKEVACYVDWKTNDNEEFSSEYQRIEFLKLYERFQSALSQAKLPSLTEDWWFYDYVVSGDSISLTLNRAKDVEINDKGELSMTADEVYTLLQVKCDYLTADEYAALHGVKNSTVRQWIRRGKLRHAKKFGNTWLIPSICEYPKRGFEEVLYEWAYLPAEIIEQFPFLSGVNSIFIIQDENNKSSFLCYPGFPYDDRPSVALSKSETEKLEVALISEPSVNVPVR